jgi:hypothetical protein
MWPADVGGLGQALGLALTHSAESLQGKDLVLLLAVWAMDPAQSRCSKSNLLNWRLTPVILATQEAEIRSIVVQSQPRQIVCETFSPKNPSQKKGLVEWLKMQALSSNPSTAKKKIRRRRIF